MGINRPGTGITSPVKIIANIFVSFIGAGMLGLPFAFKESGIMEGALIMAIVGYLSVAAMLMLIDCKYAILSSGGRAGGRSIIMETKVPLIPPDSSDDEDEDERHPPTPSTDLTYGDVGLYAFGPGGKRLVDITIVISQIGFCCGYLIYLGKNLNMYIPQISQRGWLFLLLPPLYSLTLLRHLNKLAVFSLFAQVSNVFALAVVFWFDFSHSESVPFHPKEFSLVGFPFFFAVSIYCYEGAGMILSLEESVAENRREKFRPIFICTMTGLTTLYICFGVSGYASFGRHTKDIITLNLPHGDGSVDFAAMVKICLGIALFFTYPMMMFPVTHLLDKTFGFSAVTYKGNIMRLVLVAVTGLVVSGVPNFAILMGLIGATCCTLLAFILPAAFHMSIFKQRLTKKQWYFDAMLIFLGVTGSIIGVWDAFNRMNGHNELLEVNEFSQIKMKNNTFLNSSNSSVTAKPTSSLVNLSATVMSSLSDAHNAYYVSPINGTSVKPTVKQMASTIPKEMGVSSSSANIAEFAKVSSTRSAMQVTSAGENGPVIRATTKTSGDEIKQERMEKMKPSSVTKVVKDSTPTEGVTKSNSSPKEEKTKNNSTPMKEKTKINSTPLKEKTKINSTPLKEKTKINSTPMKEKTKINSTPMKEKTKINTTPNEGQSKSTATSPTEKTVT